MQSYLKMVVYGKMVKMKEESVTKSIIKYLKQNGWNIFSYDFPQSGTGFFIHPNDRSDKIKKAIVPDIIANKESTCIIMENKSRYYEKDFIKLHNLKNDVSYSDDLNSILKRLNCNNIKYGIGLPLKDFLENKSEEHLALVDFIITVDDSKNCKKYL